MSADKPLAGKVALITGASSGLGERFASLLSGQGAGVVLAARSTDKLEALAAKIGQGGGRAFSVAMDVTDLPSIAKAVAGAEAHFGKIDILLNNSGVNAQQKLLDVTPDKYDFIMNTNAKGAFFVAQTVARGMVERKIEGRIVNIASVAGLKVLSQLGIYCMSKAAVVQMTKAMALEWGRYGINVNAICPGYIETGINRDYWATDGGQKLMQSLPRRRVGKPDDLDGLVALLVGPQSGFINGSVIAADDGLALT